MWKNVNVIWDLGSKSILLHATTIRIKFWTSTPQTTKQANSPISKLANGMIFVCMQINDYWVHESFKLLFELLLSRHLHMLISLTVLPLTDSQVLWVSWWRREGTISMSPSLSPHLHSHTPACGVTCVLETVEAGIEHTCLRLFLFFLVSPRASCWWKLHILVSITRLSVFLGVSL